MFKKKQNEIRLKSFEKKQSVLKKKKSISECNSDIDFFFIFHSFCNYH
jgi:hypothetical protein